MRSKRDNKLHAWTARVGSKGQIVIPKQAREIFSIEPGDNIIILGDERRGLVIMNGESATKILMSIEEDLEDKE
ncbi:MULTISPECIES: AbrB/MazE/SpoVT family DNA-binding domain-containing protein [Streptococcus]|uniref:Transcriptional regulator n=3 Tax=Streptococcus TaxID=1301 RepID=A0A380JGW3_STRDO|nr:MULTISPECIES: AbrB/MazE/SpoVT family DNA-binding domain-containing protein [Streptococcus]AWN18954.1 AbrB/MazE/SpoVT family DNA-binding domain-containing protein [Streptococcus sobrinus]AWN20861.1 AbrB/MazE/SpoVT family DNA-binding domain-containing protein [Streptococcus sobrinus]AWN61583.1 AbrB/MazE/SpoVT family DNA-binding domain-containing protein [Streptococcus sobrinus]AWN63455.1 AbrB/MazE/SpoVT family DNA-binding domain-containing protein [Streptococcus sobrinus]EMP71199.1 AbrB famil